MKRSKPIKIKKNYLQFGLKNKNVQEELQILIKSLFVAEFFFASTSSNCFTVRSVLLRYLLIKTVAAVMITVKDKLRQERTFDNNEPLALLKWSNNMAMDDWFVLCDVPVSNCGDIAGDATWLELVLSSK